MNYLNSRLDKWCAKCQINDLLYSSNCAYSDEEGKKQCYGNKSICFKKGLNLRWTGRSSTKQV